MVRVCVLRCCKCRCSSEYQCAQAVLCCDWLAVLRQNATGAVDCVARATLDSGYCVQRVCVYEQPVWAKSDTPQLLAHMKCERTNSPGPEFNENATL